MGPSDPEDSEHPHFWCHAGRSSSPWLSGDGARSACRLPDWAVGLALFFPFFALGGLELVTSSCSPPWACVGLFIAVWVALFASIAGGVMAILVASYSGYLRKAFVNLWCIVMYWRIEGPVPGSRTDAEHTQRPALSVRCTRAGGSKC